MSIGWIILINLLLLDKLIQCTCMYMLDTLCADEIKLNLWSNHANISLSRSFSTICRTIKDSLSIITHHCWYMSKVMFFNDLKIYIKSSVNLIFSILIGFVLITIFIINCRFYSTWIVIILIYISRPWKSIIDMARFSTKGV